MLRLIKAHNCIRAGSHAPKKRKQRSVSGLARTHAERLMLQMLNALLASLREGSIAELMDAMPAALAMLLPLLMLWKLMQWAHFVGSKMLVDMMAGNFFIKKASMFSTSWTISECRAAFAAACASSTGGTAHIA